MKKTLPTPMSEDWVIFFVAAALVALSLLIPSAMPTAVTSLSNGAQWFAALKMYLLITAVTLVAQVALRRSVIGILPSLLSIFMLSIGAGALAQLPLIKGLGIESVFFSVLIGLFISNVWGVPAWLRPAVQSEFYIKIGIVCLGSTILIGDVMKSGAYGLIQSLVVVVCVWNFTFWLAHRMRVDREMGTMLSSAVSICGVSAAIATCGVIKGDGKKLSYVVSLVLVCAIPMMYFMPLLARWMGLSQEVAGAWIGGTIDTTGAVAASGEMIGAVAAQTAIIVKSSQNVLLGVAAFAISLLWSRRSSEGEERPTLRVIWSRFPKFVLGFILASLIFSLAVEPTAARSAIKVTKGLSTTLFSLAFVCIGLETRFAEIFSRENRKPLLLFLSAQLFNILFTLVVSYIVFGLLLPQQTVAL